MSRVLLTGLIAAGVFGFCMLAMAVGLFIRGTIMRGGCGSKAGERRCSGCGSDKSGNGEKPGAAAESTQAGKPVDVQSA